MQLNIYVPVDRAEVVRALDEAARTQGRPKSEIVLDALDEYLRRTAPALGSFHLGATALPDRDQLYLERWER